MAIGNKEKVVSIFEGFATQNIEALKYINPNQYIQHNLALGDGLQGLKDLFARLPLNSKVDIIRVLQDGDFVAVHSEYHTSRHRIGFDIFRFEDGSIVEHWDNLQEPERPNPSGHTMIDGPTAVTDLEKTETNKTLIRNFLDDIFVNGKMDKLASYFDGDNYTEHNPQGTDSLSELSIALAEWIRQGVILKYEKIHKVLGEGNFVLALSEGYMEGQYTAFYDLFRVESGKIAEHWDVLEQIPAKENWKHKNGKF